ncbi:MAG: methylmalonyl-CoA mutase small subunit [Ardenticatenaceae bacterium]|nr:methylmalonyl-CoA mutase small subunit [Ardenticatenaceae bacterium]
MSESSAALFAEFTPPSYEEWVEATVQSLKGRPLAKLNSQTAEGIEIRPFYTTADNPNEPSQPGQPPYRRGTLNQPWLIAQPIPAATPQQFNQALLANLRRGQTAVYLQPGQPPINTTADLATALDGVVFAAAPILLASGPAILPLLSEVLAQTNQPLSDLHGGLWHDPLAELAQSGTAALEYTYQEVANWLHWAVENAPNFRTLAVDTAVYHNGGANAVQELAFALATGVQHMRTLQDHGLSIAQIASQLRFVFAIGGDFFMEIAKLRAARQLWAQVVAAFGGDAEAQKMVIHAETAVTNLSRLDPYVNMLRTTTEAFAAAVGGVDSLCTLPFNQPFAAEPDEFARRIARNQQLILQEEANLTQLIDPAGGAYYAEWLTDHLGQTAWALFQEIEAQGGMVAALQAGLPQQWVAATAVARAANLAKRKEVLVGVNQYANVGEPVNGERSSVSGGQSPSSNLQIQPIQPIRLAEPYEALRDWAAVYETRNGRRPQIFLANMGPIRQHKARADFTRGFFEVGGFEIVDSEGFDGVETAVAAALSANAHAVVICSTDETYPALVKPLVQGIKAQQPDTVVILAGYPQDQIEAHKAAGIDAFIYLGADCLALNQWLQSQLS